MPSRIDVLDAIGTHRAAMREAEEMMRMERAMLVHHMRIARGMGVSLQDIADRMGLSRQRVFDMLKDDQRRREPVPADDLLF